MEEMKRDRYRLSAGDLAPVVQTEGGRALAEDGVDGIRVRRAVWELKKQHLPLDVQVPSCPLQHGISSHNQLFS